MERRQHFSEGHSVFIDPDRGVTFSMPPSQGGYHAPGAGRMEAPPLDAGASEATAAPDVSRVGAAEHDVQEPRGRRVRRFLGRLARRTCRRCLIFLRLTVLVATSIMVSSAGTRLVEVLTNME